MGWVRVRGAARGGNILKRVYLLPVAYAVDAVAGDPEWLPHPVRLIGLTINYGERLLRSGEETAAQKRWKGTALTAGLVVSSYFVARSAIERAHRRSYALACYVELLLAWTCLAARNLQDEAEAVCAALERDDLPLARKRLARIVGRDTLTLDASEVSRGLIETLAESASDGIIAPLFYLALGGVPLAIAYKAVNTLDSMIGHRDERYVDFGKFAARLDDVANYIPARLTALCTVGVAAASSEGNAGNSRATWLRDGRKHKSPNAGQPEAAMAGALGVRLGGENYYDGELVLSPVIGAEFPAAGAEQARSAMKLAARAALMGLCVSVAFAFLRRSKV